MSRRVSLGLPEVDEAAQAVWDWIDSRCRLNDEQAQELLELLDKLERAAWESGYGCAGGPP